MNLTVKKADENDWDNILQILNATKLSFWFTGGENHKKFYYVENDDTKEIVCCFQIHIENDVGIIRSFAVNPKVQKKGIGRKIVNDLIIPLAKSLDINRLYARGNALGDFNSNGFWKKTIFSHINNNEIKDKVFKDDIEGAIKKYGPDLFYPNSAFYLEVT